LLGGNLLNNRLFRPDSDLLVFHRLFYRSYNRLFYRSYYGFLHGLYRSCRHIFYDDFILLFCH
jgi:hypothetical protein